MSLVMSILGHFCSLFVPNEVQYDGIDVEMSKFLVNYTNFTIKCCKMEEEKMAVKRKEKFSKSKCPKMIILFLILPLNYTKLASVITTIIGN